MNKYLLFVLFVLCLSFLSIVEAKPLKVFILAGQSNMQGHAAITTFDSMASDKKTTPILKEMRNADGTPKVCEQVWISSIGCLGDAYSDLTEKTGKLTAGFGAPDDKIGPEFTFGIYMEKMLNEPILIIKTAWGGRSLMNDFRPPSAGPRQLTEHMINDWKGRGQDPKKEFAEETKHTGVIYKHMLSHVQMVLKDIKRVIPTYDPKQGYELAGFVWFQGFNDFVDGRAYANQNQPGGYDEYADLMCHFIRDVRKDLSAPRMPFVIGVMGIGGIKAGQKGEQKYFRQAQSKPTTLDDFKGNVIAVETAAYWDDELEDLANRMENLEDKLNEQFAKTPKMTESKKEAAREKAINKEFKPEEVKRLKTGVSNGGYHYLGAAKIIAPIGKAFAEALQQPMK